MKTIKILITIPLLFFMLAPVRSTDTSPIDTGYVWSVVDEDISYQGGYNAWTHAIKLEGDTIINDTIYYLIYRLSDSTSNNWNKHNYYLRQDSAKVFLRGFYGEEHLLYDFGMEPGDTIMNWRYQILWQVIEVDSVYIDEKWRKQLHLEDYNYSDITDTWIEGIGSIFGVLTPGNMFLNISSFLLCVQRDGQLVYQRPDFTSCWLIADVESYAGNSGITIYPNPAGNTLNIKNSSIPPDRFSIYSNTGILCLEGKLNDDTIDISRLGQGLYLLRITDQSGRIAALLFEKLWD